MDNKKLIQHKQICAELSLIYDKKNKDYGDSFSKSFEEYGTIMCAIRMEDKLNRFKSLAVNSGTQQVNNESIEDTLLDLANYAIMTAMELAARKK